MALTKQRHLGTLTRASARMIEDMNGHLIILDEATERGNSESLVVDIRLESYVGLLTFSTTLHAYMTRAMIFVLLLTRACQSL